MHDESVQAGMRESVCDLNCTFYVSNNRNEVSCIRRSFASLCALTELSSAASSLPVSEPEFPAKIVICFVNHSVLVYICYSKSLSAIYIQCVLQH